MVAVADWDIPNLVDASVPEQARLQSVHLDAMIAARKGCGVVSGGSGSQRVSGGAAMFVDVSAWVVLSNWKRLSGAAATVAIGANASGNPRFDLVYISSAGAVTVLPGTPVAVTTTTTPAVPNIPAGGVPLFAVNVPSGASSILDVAITGLQVKLSRQAINITQFGAVGDDATDNTTAIANALAALSVGGKLVVPEGIFRASVLLQSDMRLELIGTLKGNGAANGGGGAWDGSVRIPAAAHDIDFYGSGWVDGANTYGPIQSFGASGATPQKRVNITGIKIKNSPATGGLSVTNGIWGNDGSFHDSTIKDVFLTNVGAGIIAYNPHYTSFINIKCDGTISTDTTVIGDFINLYNQNVTAYPSGEGVIIDGCEARNIVRNGIEVQIAAGGTKFNGGIIRNCVIRIAAAATNDIFAISAPNWDFGEIAGCKLFSANFAANGAGIEASAKGLHVHDCSVQGWAIGIWNTGLVTADSTGDDVTIEDCTIRDSYTGLLLANTSTSSQRQLIRRNKFHECRDIAIWGANTNSGHSRIEDNEIYRSVLQTGDGSRTFKGIVMQDLGDKTLWIKRNTIILGNIAIGGFHGIEFYNTVTTRSELDENYIASLTASPLGNGIQYEGASSDLFIRKNRFKNLSQVGAGANWSQTQRGWFEQNVNEGCGDTNTPSGFYGTVIGQAGAQSATPTPLHHYYGSAAPSGGTYYYRQGDVVWNTGAASGGTMCWVCTVAGAPGTWVARAL